MDARRRWKEKTMTIRLGAGRGYGRAERSVGHVDSAIREGAKFWLSVFTELQNRGVKDIFIAYVDGLTGLPEAIETLYPQTRVQLCRVHLVRNSLKYVSYKHRKEVEASLKLIDVDATDTDADVYLDLCADKWERQYPAISKLCRI